MAKKQAATETLAAETLVDEVLVELNAALDALEPELEGLTDYRRLDLQPASIVEIDDAIVDYTRRQELLGAAIDALEALLADAYPELPVRQVAEQIYADLTTNAATITAALAKFSSFPSPAVSLNPTAGEAEPK